MSSVKNLPRRWLPPGSLMMLYHEWGRPNVSHLGRHTFALSFNQTKERSHESHGLEFMLNSVSCSATFSRYAMFWKTYDQHWRQILKFLPTSTHGTCDECAEFKDLFRSTPATWSSLWNSKWPSLHRVCRSICCSEFICFCSLDACCAHFFLHKK